MFKKALFAYYLTFIGLICAAVGALVLLLLVGAGPSKIHDTISRMCAVGFVILFLCALAVVIGYRTMPGENKTGTAKADLYVTIVVEVLVLVSTGILIAIGAFTGIF